RVGHLSARVVVRGQEADITRCEELEETLRAFKPKESRRQTHSLALISDRRRELPLRGEVQLNPGIFLVNDRHGLEKQFDVLVRGEHPCEDESLRIRTHGDGRDLANSAVLNARY